MALPAALLGPFIVKAHIRDIYSHLSGLRLYMININWRPPWQIDFEGFINILWYLQATDKRRKLPANKKIKQNK